MRVYTVHVRDGADPRLVREGFSWGGLLLGPLWLLGAGAWITACLVAAASLTLGLFEPFRAVGEAALTLLVGLSAGDLVRFELGLRGWRIEEVVAGANMDAAFTRLIDARPELGRPRPIPSSPPSPPSPIDASSASPWS